MTKKIKCEVSQPFPRLGKKPLLLLGTNWVADWSREKYFNGDLMDY